MIRWHFLRLGHTDILRMAMNCSFSFLIFSFVCLACPGTKRKIKRYREDYAYLWARKRPKKGHQHGTESVKSIIIGRRYQLWVSFDELIEPDERAQRLQVGKRPLQTGARKEKKQRKQMLTRESRWNCYPTRAVHLGKYTTD